MLVCWRRFSPYPLTQMTDCLQGQLWLKESEVQGFNALHSRADVCPLTNIHNHSEYTSVQGWWVNIMHTYERKVNIFFATHALVQICSDRLKLFWPEDENWPLSALNESLQTQPRGMLVWKPAAYLLFWQISSKGICPEKENIFGLCHGAA